jgi:hypothetical protein
MDGLADFAASASSTNCRDHLALHTADALVVLLAGAATAEGQALQRFMAGADTGGRDAADRD